VISDRNLIRKADEKELEYTNLSVEIQRMWNTKRFVIPVITGATGTVTKGLKTHLQTTPSLSRGVHYWFKRSSRKKTVIRDDNDTLYTLT
jgi:hypothetical protein